jgi:hypothetical protein
MRKHTNYTIRDVSGCELVGCEDGSQARKSSKELEQFCADSKQSVYLGNEFDLYRVSFPRGIHSILILDQHVRQH